MIIYIVNVVMHWLFFGVLTFFMIVVLLEFCLVYFEILYIGLLNFLRLLFLVVLLIGIEVDIL